MPGAPRRSRRRRCPFCQTLFRPHPCLGARQQAHRDGASLGSLPNEGGLGRCGRERATGVRPFGGIGQRVRGCAALALGHFPLGGEVIELLASVREVESGPRLALPPRSELELIAARKSFSRAPLKGAGR